jgi:simple sugar transport system permease protein
MALLYLGGENAQMAANLPQSITQLFQGMVLFFLLACDVLILYRPRLRAWRFTQPVSGKTEHAA